VRGEDERRDLPPRPVDRDEQVPVAVGADPKPPIARERADVLRDALFVERDRRDREDLLQEAPGPLS